MVEKEQKKSLRRSWRSSGPVAKVTAICTAIIAGATLLYMVFAGWQLYEIRSGSEETRRLARAATDQANATHAQLDSMRDQANTMRSQSNTLKESLAETRKSVQAIEKQANASMMQARTSETLAKATEDSAKSARESVETSREATLTANRAQISVGSSSLDVDSDPKRFILYIVWHNDGNSFATLTGTIRIKYGPTVSEGCDYRDVNVRNVQVAPKSPRTQRFLFFKENFNTPDMSPSSPNRQYVMFCGRISYESLGRTYEMPPLCAYYDMGLKEFIDCEGSKERP